ncbi:MAG: IclR family transcriptional regulator [Desulfobacterota bacterium]|nr:IclR family transcriptional regulator [Thermodesulfobacteriota bacterium]
MDPSRNFIESLSRGLNLLSTLAESPFPLTLTELSRHLHLSRSTVQRLLYTLLSLKYLDREEATKKYRLGQRALLLGLSIAKHSDLRKVAFPHLEKTSQEIGETVNLAILDGTEIVYVERIKTQQILNINLEVGSRLPAYCTSMGKAILAFLPPKRLEALLKEMKLKPRTPFTLVSKSALKRELDKVRRTGFAINNEELSIGLRSVAAPVRNAQGEVIAAVNIAVPSSRVDLKRLETELAQKAIETANRISYTLGYRKEAP